MKWLTRIQYIALFLISLIIVGAASVITGEFGIGEFKKPLFYVQQILKYVAIICTIAGTILSIIDKFKSTDEEYLSCEKKIKNFAQTIYIPSIFTRYCEYANKKRKIRQHIYNVKQKLFRLERKATEEDIYRWGHDREAAIAEKNPYCYMRMMLEERLTKEWITEYIDTTSVDYDQINADIVLGGIYARHGKFAANDYITKHKGALVVRAKAPWILLSFAISTFASSFVVGMRFNASALLNFLVGLLILVIQVVLSIRFSHNYCQNVTLRDIRFRTGIITEYERWIEQEAEKTDTSADTSYADEIFDEMQLAQPVKKKLGEKIHDSAKGYIDQIKHIVETIQGGDNEDVRNDDSEQST